MTPMTTDTTDPIAAALYHIRCITPADAPWTPAEFAPPGHGPTPTDRAISTILNAVAEGQLINRASRDEMLAQVRRGEGFATAGAEDRWIADTEAGVYDTDVPDPIAAARALISDAVDFACAANHHLAGQAPEQALQWRDALAILTDATDERAKVAAAYEAAASVVDRANKTGPYQAVGAARTRGSPTTRR